MKKAHLAYVWESKTFCGCSCHAGNTDQGADGGLCGNCDRIDTIIRRDMGRFGVPQRDRKAIRMVVL